MKFAIFDELRCSCGNDRLRLEDALTIPAAGPDSSGAICSRFCGWKQRPMAASQVTPAECQDCRRQTIFRGRIRCDCGQAWPIVEGVPSFSTQYLAPAQSGRFRVTETNPRTDPRWEPFVRAHPHGSPFQHPGWLRALEEEYGQPRRHLACEDCQGRLLAILPMFYTRGLPFNYGPNVTKRRLSSLPRTPTGGILSVDGEATAVLLQTAVQCAQQDSGVQLQIKTEDPELDGLVEGLVRVPWRPTYQLPLPDTPELIRFGNSTTRHRIKWAVNKALKLGVEVREADSEIALRDWYVLYLHVMRRNAVPPRSYRFFRSLWALLRPAKVMRLLLAERPDGTQRNLLGGSIILTFGGTASYSFTGGRKEDFACHLNDLIQWTAIHDACRMGARRYDFGEVAEEHMTLLNFKSKWGAEPVPLYRYYSPAPPTTCEPDRNSATWFRRTTAFAWRQLPLDATARMGDWIYSYL